MNNVHQVLDWMKAYPLMVLCIVIMLVSLVSFYYPTYRTSSEFRSVLSERGRDIDTLQGLRRTSITAPGPEPDDAPLQLQVVANSGAISQLESIYNDLEREYQGVYRTVSQLNQRGHEPMLDGLLPDPGSFQSRRFQARDAYAAAFATLYKQLNAGSVPTQAEVDDLLNQEREAMLRQIFPAPEQLNEEQTTELRERQRERLFSFLREHPTMFSVFADPVSLDIRGDWNPGPFDVGDWAQSSNPDMFDIWEGQLQLWIQQDLVRAINRANGSDDPADSLLTMPVKRLLFMEVLPGYIGDLQPVEGPVDESAAEQLISDLESQASERLPQDFSVSPTGRVSNAIYDVRHAKMAVIVDSQQIPALLNAINDVNMMTVIGTDIEDIDEYAHLRDFYYYGSVDAVRLDLVVETIWLRSWTAGHLSQEHAEELDEPFNSGLMPDSVRMWLGLPPRELEEASDGGGSGAGGQSGAAPARGGTPSRTPTDPGRTPTRTPGR
ncbi:MAG: hypothetical protein WD294_04030 [Phycisphaeraceae bacterium]